MIYQKSIYLYDINIDRMKTISLKLDDSVFSETEKVLAQIKKSRNRYINEAIDFYNKLNKRKYLASKLAKESKLTGAESLKVLYEFDMVTDESEAI